MVIRFTQRRSSRCSQRPHRTQRCRKRSPCLRRRTGARRTVRCAPSGPRRRRVAGAVAGAHFRRSAPAARASSFTRSTLIEFGRQRN